MTSFPTSIKAGPTQALVMIELGPLVIFALCFLIFLDEWSSYLSQFEAQRIRIRIKRSRVSKDRDRLPTDYSKIRSER